MSESRRHSRSLAKISLEPHHEKTGFAVMELSQRWERIVFAAVIHHDNFIFFTQRCDNRGNFLDQRFDVFFLVINRYDDRKLHRSGVKVGQPDKLLVALFDFR